jgi:hypothetical protein
MPAGSAPTELLHSLGRVARGLSALFWGLPLALVVSVQTAANGSFGLFDLAAPGGMDGPPWVGRVAAILFGAFLGALPAVLANALILYGLLQFGSFQKRERVWRQAVDRAQLFAVVNVGLAPFLCFLHRMPDHAHFRIAVAAMAVSGLLLLLQLNRVMQRLAAMLPDETLRLDTRLFTTVNIAALAVLLLLLLLEATALHVRWLPPMTVRVFPLLERAWVGGPVLLVLLPLALTMTLLWKTKETILAGIFSHGA